MTKFTEGVCSSAARVLAIFALILGGCVGSDVQSPLVLLSLDNEEVKLMEVTSEKALVIIFMRTDCPIANRYAPTIAELAAEFQSSDLRFALVYPTRRESANSVQQHLDTYSLSLTRLMVCSYTP